MNCIYKKQSALWTLNGKYCKMHFNGIKINTKESSGKEVRG